MMPLLQPWYRHSPWSGNTFLESPSAFLWRFGFARRDKQSGKSSAGRAVEGAVTQVLLGTASELNALGIAEAQFDREMHGEITPERDDLAALIEQALAAMREVGGRVLNYQSILRLEAGERFGLAHAVKCKTDFTMDSGTAVDLKCTWRVPNEPKFQHLAQLGCYRALTGRPQTVLYVSPKKSKRFDLVEADMDAGWANMLAAWHCIDETNRMFATPEDAAKIFAINPDSYLWDNLEQLAEATKIWKTAQEDEIKR